MGFIPYQWRIHDFPYTGRHLVGRASTPDVSFIKFVQTIESLPLVGCAPGVPPWSSTTHSKFHHLFPSNCARFPPKRYTSQICTGHNQIGIFFYCLPEAGDSDAAHEIRLIGCCVLLKVIPKNVPRSGSSQMLSVDWHRSKRCIFIFKVFFI